MMLTKTAILIEWVRIFVPERTRNAFFWASTALIVANLGLYTAGIVASLVGCRPLHMIWHFWVQGVCINRNARNNANAIFNLVIDVFIFILPQKVIWTLQASWGRKISVSVIFCIGLLYVYPFCFHDMSLRWC